MHVLSFPSAQEVQRTGKSVVRMAEYFAMLVYQTIAGLPNDRFGGEDGTFHAGASIVP
jgi:hypothetical protein